MSEQSIQNILSKAYAKAGKILGRKFKVYRPVNLNDAFSEENFIVSQDAAFTLSSAFTAPQAEGFRPFTCYTNHLAIQPGDIFSDTHAETFVVVWNRGIEDVVAIRADHLISVERATWSTNGGFAPVLGRIAKNVPASIVGTGSAGENRIGNVDASAPTLRWDIRILTAGMDIKNTDNIRMSSGQLLRVDNVTHTDLFMVLTCTEVPNGS